MSRKDNSGKGKASGRGAGNTRKGSNARGNAPLSRKKPTTKKPNKSGNTNHQENPNGIRLNKYIANSGICSRREADTYITNRFGFGKRKHCQPNGL